LVGLFMTKMDLVEVVLELGRGKLEREDADDVVTGIFRKISNSLVAGDTVKMFGIGSLSLFKGSPRVCRNVIAGTTIAVPAKTRVKFVTSSLLKSRLTKLDEKRLE
jgi:integration host factor subunit alpha